MAVDLDVLATQAQAGIVQARADHMAATSLQAQRAVLARHGRLSGGLAALTLHRQLLAQRSDRYLAAQARATASAAALAGLKQELAQAEAEVEKLDGVKSPVHQRAWQTAQALGYQLPAVQARADADRAAAQDMKRLLGDAQAALDRAVADLQQQLGAE